MNKRSAKLISFSILIAILFCGCDFFGFTKNTGTNVNINANSPLNTNVAVDYKAIVDSGGAEVSEEMNDYFNKIMADNKDGKVYTPVVYLDNLKESAHGETFICKTVKNSDPDNPYWSLVCLDDEKDAVGMIEGIDMPASVLDKYSDYAVPSNNPEMAKGQFPDTYEISPEMLKDFEEACKSKSAKNVSFTFVPIILLGTVSAESGDYSAILCLEYFPDIDDSQFFATYYMVKDHDGKCYYLNASTILW